MSDSQGRTFNEEEVSRLLQLAIQQQEADTEAKYNLDHGLSLEEIQRIAAEAGIDAKYIRHALQNLDKKEEPDIKPGFWGAPIALVYDTNVPGQLTEKVMVDILAEIRKEYKDTRGNFAKLKNSFEWTNAGASSMSPSVVQAQPLNNATHLLIKERMDSFLALSYLPAGLALMLSTLIFLKEPTTTAFLVATIVTSVLFFSARWANWRNHKKRHKALTTLQNNITRVIEKNDSANWSYGDQTSARGSLLDLEESEGYLDDEEKMRASNKTKS
ncbi:MAG: hypothetical protein AB8G77_24510 [Rhodothermales bacterium]